MSSKKHNRDSVRIPPLKSLQSFEAAARHLSFKTAAAELHVTPTAISHQVKSLEEYLGVKLFHRLTRSVKLTADGDLYAPLINEAFQKIAEASLLLQSDNVDGKLIISTTPSLAGQWLSPRLPTFQKRFPNLSVSVISTDEVSEFSRDDIDVAIRYGFGDYPGLHVAWVLDDFVAPICAPDFKIDVNAPETLLSAPLVNYQWHGFSTMDPSWAKWLRAMGIEQTPKNAIATYDDERMCIQAAVDGHGIALVSLIAAAKELEDGRVIAPFSNRLKNKSYYFACPKTSSELTKIRAFQDWLLDEADTFRDSSVGAHYLS